VPNRRAATSPKNQNLESINGFARAKRNRLEQAGTVKRIAGVTRQDCIDRFASLPYRVRQIKTPTHLLLGFLAGNLATNA
jgi:hypothetical protein